MFHFRADPACCSARVTAGTLAARGYRIVCLQETMALWHGGSEHRLDNQKHCFY
jgi:hypothetical protein